MPTPFPPNGPQVQAALQKMPTPQLQQYAAAQPPQPTGQVAPGPGGPAGLELAFRNAGQQAAGRERAMQNNPQESPTVFQQKDREMAQQQQQLAAMQQQMQQKEKQLGVLGALMAKKAQDMQARESMGVATLPIRPDMFTAMDGGIVFSNGGGVERYARRGLVQDLGMISPLREDRMAEGFTEREPITRVSSEEEKAPLDVTIASIRNRLAQFETALRGTNLSPEKKAELLKAAEAKLAAQYSTYKQGLASLDTETKAALEGEAPTFQQRIARGLANIPANISGMRLGQGLAMLGAGAGQVDADYEKRRREAAQYMVDAKRKGLAADLAEARGLPELARKLVAGEEADLAKTADIEAKIAKAGMDVETGIAGLQSKEQINAAKLEAAEKLQIERLKSADTLMRVRMDAYEDRTKLMNEVQLEKIKAVQAGEGKTDLQVARRIIEARLGAANAKLPPDQRLSSVLIADEALKEATTLLYGYRNVNAAATSLRASTANAKNITEALTALKYDPNYMVASPQRKAEMEAEERARFTPSGPSSPAASSAPSNARPASAPQLPNEVSVAGTTYKRPPNFTDAQWQKYINDTGAKAK